MYIHHFFLTNTIDRKLHFSTPCEVYINLREGPEIVSVFVDQPTNSHHTPFFEFRLLIKVRSESVSGVTRASWHWWTQNLVQQKYLYPSILQDFRGHDIYPGGRGEPGDGSGRGPGPWHHRVYRGDPQQAGEDDYNDSRIILLIDRARGTWSTAPNTLVRRDCCRLAVSDGKRWKTLTSWIDSTFHCHFKIMSMRSEATTVTPKLWTRVKGEITTQLQGFIITVRK